MKKISRSSWKTLWDLRHLSVQDFLQCIRRNPELAFLGTMAGVWWILRFVLAGLIAVHVWLWVGHIFRLFSGI